MKWLQSIIIGCLIGLSVSYVVVTISALLKENYVLSGADLLEELLLALILGAVIGAATMLLDLDLWPFRVLLSVHFLIVVASVYIVGAIGDWYDMSFISIVILFVEILIIYVIVWGIMLILEKREIEDINKRIKNLILEILVLIKIFVIL